MQKVEIGFEGGQVVAVRLSDGELKDLRKQLEKGGWHDVKTEDGVALRSTSARSPSCAIDSGDHRVGFSLGSELMRARTLLGAGAAGDRSAPRSGGARTPRPAPTASASGSRRRTRSSPASASTT